MDFFEEWAEYDYNPFVVFDKDGKVTFVNQEGQFLLGFVSAKKIFTLASSYASIKYGYKTTIIDIDFDKYSFFALTVGYKDDEQLGIKLYKKPTKSFDLSEEDNTKVNIYSIIDLAISSFSTQSRKTHKKLLDPTFPELYLKVDDFLKLLSKIYRAYEKSNSITTKLSLITGECVIYKKKKYSIFSLEIRGELREEGDDFLIKEVALSANASLNIKKSVVRIELPLIDS